MNIFTYGSLMFDAVWARVIGVDYAKIKARVHGYRRRALKGYTYPALIPGYEDDFVEGVVYLKVNRKDVKTLDRFEGKYYRRRLLPCSLADGSSVDAGVYLFKKEYHQMLADKPWDAGEFESVGIQTFLAKYKGFADTKRIN